MNVHRQLELFPELPPIGRPDPDADALRCRAGVEYHELAIRDVLCRTTNHRLPFAWSINPYRGCEFGCTYCYARYTHEFLELERWEDFETKVFIKSAAAIALRRQLGRAARRGEGIAIGTATDPYQPAEHRYRITRGLLEVFREFEGLDFSITTKSPIVIRDIDLLADLKEKHRLSVNVTVTTLDRALARRLEPYAPDPAARIRTVRKLLEAGVRTNIFCMPILPGINHREDSLRPLFESVEGVDGVHANLLFLRPAARRRFLPWLAEEFPHLEPLYADLFGARDYLSDRGRDVYLADFRRLAAEFGVAGSTDA